MSKTGGKQRVLAVVRIVLGLGILWFVASRLPWRDQLLWEAQDGSTTSLSGTIRGEWKAEHVGFVVEPGSDLPASWDAFARAGVAAGEPLELERGGSSLGRGTVDWKPGMPRAFRGMDRGGLARAAACLSLGFLLVITRWWRLLALAGCRTSWFNAGRLTFLGMFFNLVVPGLTGGDLVKAVVVARENPGRRADALVSVFVDRVLGLATLALLGAVVILISGSTFAELRNPLLVFLGVGVLSVTVYVNPFLRRKLRLGALVDRLPLGDKLRAADRAALLYLRHPLQLAFAVGLSLANHLLIVMAVYSLGLAFGVEEANVGLREYLVVVPVANIVSALPLAPGGWGLGEAAYAFLFGLVGASATLGVAVSVTFRLIMLAFGLVGGLFLLLPGGQVVREAEHEVELEGTA